MSDSVVVMSIGLIYTASSGGLFYLSKHFVISYEEIRQIVNLPLAKIKEQNISEILESFNKVIESLSIPVSGAVKFQETQRKTVESLYDGLSQRLARRRTVIRCHKRLRFIKTSCVLNVVVSVFVLFYVVVCLLLGSLRGSTTLILTLEAKQELFGLLFLLPWVFFVLIYYAAGKYEATLSSAAGTE